MADDRRIRKIDLDALTVTTIAGSATSGSADGVGAAATFNNVRGPFAHDGMLYLVDADDSTLRSIDPDSTQVTTLAGVARMTGNVDGFSSNARFISPRNIAGEGKFLYIADTNGAVIRRYNIDTAEVTTVLGNGLPATIDGIGVSAQVRGPRGMAVWGGFLWFADFDDDVIRRMDIPLAATSVTLNVTKTAQKAKAKGKVEPSQAGGEVVVALFRKSNGAFRKKSEKTVDLSDTSSYSASFNRLAAGQCKFTTRWAGDEDSTASKKSVTFSC